VDGWVAVAAFSREEFQGLCDAMDAPELFTKYAEPADRLAEEPARDVLRVVTEWTAKRKVSEVEELASRHGFAASRVLRAEDVYHGGHFRQRATVQTYEDALYGEMIEPCYPPRLSATPGRLKWAARPVGMDNEYVLTKILGLSSERVTELTEHGVIFKWNPQVPSHCPPVEWDGKGAVKYP
jgi:crotonobetainyl-CoA:carnitine CoA-transferase CaiB-like acyl-CoA transferase